MKNRYIFTTYLDGNTDDLVEIAVQAENEHEAIIKIKKILNESIDIQSAGLYLDNWLILDQ